jgi:hypothetical protein
MPKMQYFTQKQFWKSRLLPVNAYQIQTAVFNEITEKISEFIAYLATSNFNTNNKLHFLAQTYMAKYAHDPRRWSADRCKEFKMFLEAYLTCKNTTYTAEIYQIIKKNELI